MEKPAAEGVVIILPAEVFPPVVKFLEGVEGGLLYKEVPPDYYLILYFNLKLSAIIAMNSEFVGFPRLFWMV